MLRKDKVRLEELMAPEFVLHTAHPTYPETPREMWLDNLFNHLVIDKWQQTDIFSGVAGPGEGLAAADPGLRWGGCSSGGARLHPLPNLRGVPCTASPSSPGSPWRWQQCPRPQRPRTARPISSSSCGWPRSEEHTSELQSLMRITY